MALEVAVMFQSWRVKIREAESALTHGRLEEATRILLANQRELMQYQPALSVAAKTTAGWVEQSSKQLAMGSFAAAWMAWDYANKLSPQLKEVLEQRERLVERLAESAGRELDAGRFEAVFEVCEPAVSRGLGDSRIRSLTQAARHWKSGHRLAQQGEFAQALSELTAAQASATAAGSVRLEDFRKRIVANQEVCRRELQDLHSALADRRWGAALAAAQAVLEKAPEHSLAKQAFQQAWREAGLLANAGPSVSHAPSGKPISKADARPTRGPRKMLWIDGVGAFLACLGDEVVVGQPDPENQVDIPILADISRKECVIRRQGEGYVLAPSKTVMVDGKRIPEPVALPDSCQIELSSGVVLEYRRPHALSGTVVLSIVSRHKTQPAADKILLMAETCVLGPSRHAHVSCPTWKQDVVLVRQPDGRLAVRTSGEFMVDGKTVKDRGGLLENSLVAGQEFSFCVENLK